MSTHRTIQEMASDTRWIIERLDRAEVGEVVTYAELGEAIGRDVRRFAAGNIQTALRHMVRDGKVFAVVRNEGYKRLNDAEIVADYDATRMRISRTARRAIAKQGAIGDFAKLPPQEQQRSLIAQSMLGAIAALTTAKAAKRLESRIADTRKQLPVGKTLEVFTDHQN